MGSLPEEVPPLFGIADATNLQQQWAAEFVKARQLLEHLPDHDGYLVELHSAGGHA
jgi:hypothetical protein